MSSIAAYKTGIKRLIFMLTLLLVGCSQFTAARWPTAIPTLAVELNPEAARTYLELRDTWEQIPTEVYVYAFEWNCECPGAEHGRVVVGIRDGKVSNLEAIRDTRVSLDEQHYGDFKSVDQLLDMVRNAINSNAASIDIEMSDPDRPFRGGFEVRIDRDANVPGDEIAWTYGAMINLSRYVRTP